MLNPTIILNEIGNVFWDREMCSLKMVVDSREPGHMLLMLSRLGVDVERKMIEVGDYILSSECAVERKTVSDFMSSMFSGRLFKQAVNLKDSYSKPIIVLEGDIRIELELRSVNTRAFLGALLSLEVDRGIPVIPTPTCGHTADLLYTLAKRLHRKNKEKGKIPVRKPMLMTEKDRQAYIVTSLPGVGGELSKRILKKFKTVRNVFQAESSDLEEVEGIGRAKVERIIHLLELQFDEA